MACYNGHLEVAQWLYEIKSTLNISAKNEEAFCLACRNDHFKVAQWIQSLNPIKYMIVLNLNNNKIIYYNIHINIINKSNTILHKKQIEICPICCDTVCNIQSSCNHTFCESCIQTWFDKNKTCPYCRACLTNTVFRPIATHL